MLYRIVRCSSHDVGYDSAGSGVDQTGAVGGTRKRVSKQPSTLLDDNIAACS